jgi:RNA polymerase sigma-70 factor (ECF subfamily)
MIEATRSGDPEGLDDLYLRYFATVLTRVRVIVRDRHDAEDVAQSVFLKLPRALVHYERRRAPFAAWLRRVAENAALDHVRSRRPVPVENVWQTNEGHEDVGSELLESLLTAFDRLPDGQREVVILRHVAGLRPGEIAERMGRSESAVHALHNRGRARVAATLRELQALPKTA